MLDNKNETLSFQTKEDNRRNSKAIRHDGMKQQIEEPVSELIWCGRT